MIGNTWSKMAPRMVKKDEGYVANIGAKSVPVIIMASESKIEKHQH